MRSVAWRRTHKGEQSSLKLLLWTAIAGLIFGLIGFGELAEDVLRSTRNSLHKHKASGDIVLVTFDDKSLKEVGRWPWPRSKYAEMIDKLSAAGADRIFFDLVMDTPTTSKDDGILEEALKRSGNVTIAGAADFRHRHDGPNPARPAPDRTLCPRRRARIDQRPLQLAERRLAHPLRITN